MQIYCNHTRQTTRSPYLWHQGITLLELLVVLAVIAIISGMGLAVLSHSDKQFAFLSTRGEIISILRYARSTAITEKMPTSVVIDMDKQGNLIQRGETRSEPDIKQIYCFAPKTIGLWHFEDNQNGVTTGALGYNAKLSPELQITSEGRCGKAVFFNKGGVVYCDNLPFISNNYGIVLDAWVYPEETRDQVIIEKMGDFSITLQQDGSLTGRLGALIVTTLPNHISLQRWSHIRMLYESNVLSLFVNGNLVSEALGKTKISTRRDTITVSSQEFPFKGKIDGVRISLYTKAEAYQLKPEDIVISSNITKRDEGLRIQFDARGRFTNGGKPGRIECSSKQARDSFEIEITPFGTVSLIEEK